MDNDRTIELCGVCGEYNYECRCSQTETVAAPALSQPEKIDLHRLDGWLIVPTKPEPSYIPLGMEADDFKLLEDSLALWKSRLIKATTGAKPLIDGSELRRE